METIKLAGSFPNDPHIEVDAHVVGQLGIHRPVYRYMPGTPVTYRDKGWYVTHVPSGGSLTQHAPKGAADGKVSLKRLKEWAANVQSHDPEAWTQLAALSLGTPRSDPELGRRILDAMRAAA